MSELKAVHAFDVYEAYTKTGDDDAAQVYLKSEADKVIARHKYKRCLAMAMWCSAELGMLVSTWSFKIKHYKKWQKRWLKIAEQFLSDVRSKTDGGKIMSIELHHLHPSHDDELSRLKARIAELEEERRWRKFPDEKPEEWATVVVIFSDGFYDLAVYMSNGQGWNIGDGLYHKSEEVTHWMPLPSAPKEER